VANKSRVLAVIEVGSITHGVSSASNNPLPGRLTLHGRGFEAVVRAKRRHMTALFCLHYQQLQLTMMPSLKIFLLSQQLTVLPYLSYIVDDELIVNVSSNLSLVPLRRLSVSAFSAHVLWPIKL
jgi:hypothetical protein